MKISIKGFKCHTDAEYLFRDGTLTLMSGPSGAGKSTVMESIYYCLYGGMRGIYSNTMKSGKTSVTITMHNCTVYRQGRPNLFQVVLNDEDHTTYEDAVAQQVIDRMFGPKDLWKACCYVDQNSRCTLLTGSNNDRMELLNLLSFSTDNPEACIVRIDTELKALRDKFTGVQAVYQSDCDAFSQELALKPVNPEVMPLIVQLADMRQRLVGSEQQRQDLDRVRMEQKRLMGMREALLDNLCERRLAYIKAKEDSICVNVVINRGMIELFQQSLIKLEASLDQMRQEHLIFIQNKAAQEHTTQEISLKQGRLAEITPPSKDRIPLLHAEIKSIDEEIPQIEGIVENIRQQKIQVDQIRILEEKLALVGSELSLHLQTEYKTEDVWANQQQEQAYAQNTLLAQQIGVDYTVEAIQKYRQEHVEAMERDAQIETRLKIHLQVKALETELATIPSEDHVLTITDDALFTARDEYTRLSQSSDLLSCPHCGNSVRYVNNSLQADTMTPVTPEQVAAALQNVTNLFNRHKNQKRSVDLKSQIDALVPQCGDRSELDQAVGASRMGLSERQGLISRLDQIKVVPKPKISSELMTTLISYRQLKNVLQDEDPNNGHSEESLQMRLQERRQRKQQCLDEINDITIKQSTWEDLHKSLDELTSKLSGLTIGSDRSEDISKTERNIVEAKNCVDKWSQIIQMEEEMAKIKQQIDVIVIIEDIEDQYNNVVKDIEGLKQQIDDTEHADKMVSKQRVLEGKRDEVVKMTEDLTNLQKLRQTAVDVECQQLQTTVDSINNAMADILDNVFDDPITVRIQLYKQLKTNKMLKASVNISISYKGAEYDSINQMSGGEGDRISFALILALNQVSTSPLLMLDEAMSSINANLRESCLRSLRDSVGINKTVIIINHEDVEGHYDEVIRF